MNGLYVAATLTALLLTMGIATHMMITNRWPWQRKPQPLNHRFHCHNCRLEGRPIAKFNTWRDWLLHDLTEHRAR